MILTRKNILTILFIIASVCDIDAQSWSPVGPGIGSDYFNSVRSLATYNGELYAGGHFNTAGNVAANNIAKWNGTNWSPVIMGTSGTVNALTVYNGDLYAGGGDIVKWNGSSWSNVGNIEAYDVKAFATYNGELYVAGWFPNFYTYGTSIAKWNGNNWTSPLPEDSLYSIYIECMTVYNDELYAAGAYYQIAGGGVANFYRVIKWNGSAWSTVVTIPASYTLDGAIGDILCMTVYNSELYIAGMFGMAIDSSTIALQIAKWNGTNWSAVGTGINPASYPWGGDSDASGYSFVKSLAIYNGALYATGRFDSCGSNATNNIAKWNGTNWTNLRQGINGPGYSLLGTDTCLFVGGWFNSVEGLPAKRIAKWKDSCAVPPPAQPSIIYGNNTVCQGSTQTYFIDTIPGSTSYSWILPPGWIGNSNSPTITVIIGDYGGEIKVIAVNSCGNSMPKTMAVTVNPLPTQLSEINGNDVVCAGNTVSYSTNQLSASFYSWNLPSGWVGTSTTSNITATAGPSGGIISVTASNSCGSSDPQILLITVDSIPRRPIFINGHDTICEGSIQSYFVDPVPGATGYEWAVPLDWTFDPNANSISVIAHYSSELSVVAFNDCGISIPQVLPITVLRLPQKPEYIDWNNLVCKGTTHLYVINPVQDAINYTWVLPLGWTGNSITDSIIAIAGSNNGIISVSANNNCGSSAYESLHVLVDTTPAKPGDIAGNLYTYTNRWNYYSIDPVNGASGYRWTAIDGTVQQGQMIHQSSVIWKKAGTYELSVQVVNHCGLSLAQKIIVNVSDFVADDPFDLKIFPTPSNGDFFLKAKRVQDKMLKVEIYDMSGHLIYHSGSRPGSNDYTQFFDLKRMADGIYIAKIIIDEKVYSRKIIKNK